MPLSLSFFIYVLFVCFQVVTFSICFLHDFWHVEVKAVFVYVVCSMYSRKINK